MSYTISAATESGEPNQLVALQDAEYKLVSFRSSHPPVRALTCYCCCDCVLLLGGGVLVCCIRCDGVQNPLSSYCRAATRSVLNTYIRIHAVGWNRKIAFSSSPSYRTLAAAVAAAVD